ncbi:MAG TPA: paraquat-inducible protein B, partial [Rheinheimera sp.]|nr:paraquat-inducible protein B [Rheinheimera sp.]
IANPHLQQLPAQLQQSLQDLQQMLAGLSPGAPAYDKLNGNLQTLDQVLRELQPVLQTLNQQSNALVFEADTAADPQPKRAKQ